jgi:hypothetical protein
MPTTADEKKQMVEQVKKREIPPTENLYQAMQEARAASDFYLKASQSSKKFALSAKTQRPQFDQSIVDLKNQSKQCSDRSESALKRGISALGPSDLELIVGTEFDSSLSENFVSVRNKIVALSGASFCTEVKKEETWTGLQKSLQEFLDKASADSAERAQWATELQAAWDERAHTLSENLKPSSKISGQLPYLVIILGAFGVGMLGLVKFFGPEIQLELVTSGQIIQFPTVVILLVVLVILGMSDKINDNTLSALLGGIAGYVLSQGVGRASERAAERRAAHNS